MINERDPSRGARPGFIFFLYTSVLFCLLSADLNPHYDNSLPGLDRQYKTACATVTPSKNV